MSLVHSPGLCSDDRYGGHGRSDGNQPEMNGSIVHGCERCPVVDRRFPYEGTQNVPRAMTDSYLTCGTARELQRKPTRIYVRAFYRASILLPSELRALATT